MKAFLIIASLFILSGCETLELQSVTVGTSHYVHPHNYVSYTLGYYTGSHYHGYQVRGAHGHRYYYAPRHWTNHRYYSRPVVVNRTVVVNQHRRHDNRRNHNRRDHRRDYDRNDRRNNRRHDRRDNRRDHDRNDRRDRRDRDRREHRK